MSYDEHLISMAGGDGDGATDQLAAIEARAQAAKEQGNFITRAQMESRLIDVDVPTLLALVREQQAKLDRGNAALFDVLHKWRNGDHVNYADIEGIRAAITAKEAGK